MKARIVSVWDGAKNMLFPVQCAGCGKWDTPLCAQCQSVARREVATGELEDDRGAPSIELLSLGEYDGELRNLVLAAKHDPYRDMSGFLREAGVTLGAVAGRGLARYYPGGVLLREQVWVVPAPSSHARRRKRMEIVPSIAAGVALGLRQELTARIQVVPAVKLRRGVGSQGGKSAGVRGRGRAGTIYTDLALPDRTLAVIVDDVVTTGATLRAVCEALEGRVVQAVALAVA